MKISHTRIILEHYRETIVQKKGERCPQCGYETSGPAARTEPDPNTGQDRNIEIRISKEEQN